LAKSADQQQRSIVSRHADFSFLVLLADRTNGRAYATVLHPLSSVCDVMHCG